ncbi:MAG TPA: hypothetical protein H9911_05630 [Candidatus Mediterraneibacter tabaqchaliae]|uniref:Cell division protein FtsL n=1 Tax=Candidatus Mediterraneibacter tabaqchaliae TaxID=2838689 RepID=A0A9D2R5N7_9FIRM|nr:hypothetical protein [Candidatus Mediterraneibacter tabaqchaliae]
MAAGYRTYDQRTTGRRGNNRGQFYVYGNAVRQAEPFPKRMPEAHPEQTGQHRQMSRQVAKNRHRAKSISPAYAVFLAAAAVCAVLVCMVYLSLQSEVVSRSENVAAMQEELAELTEANDTAYNAAVDSVNLVTVRDRAMNELGMVPESEGSVVEYDRPAGEYVKQYSDIPESGVLAKSDDASK